MEQDLDGWLKACTNTFGDNESKALESVVHWKWSKGPMHHPLPLGYERDPTRGKSVRAPKTPRSGLTENGLDHAGRVVIARAYEAHGAKGLLCRTMLVRYEQDAVHWSWHAESAGHATQEAGVVNWEDGRSVSSEIVTNHGHVTEVYEHDSLGRISSIIVTVTTNRRHRKDSRTTCTRLRACHSETEIDSIVVVDGNNAGIVLYKAKSPNDTQDVVLGLLESALLTQIPKTLSTLQLPSPAYALILVFDGAAPERIQLSVGVDQERAGSIDKHSASLYMPAERSLYPIAIADMSISQLVQRAIGLEVTDDVFFACLQRTARQFSRTPPLENIALDFVTIASDVECERLERELLEVGVSKT
jgi:hypothetical protein